MSFTMHTASDPIGQATTTLVSMPPVHTPQTAMVAEFMSEIETMLQSTPEGRLQYKIRLAVKDYEGCVGIVTADRHNAVLAAMNSVIALVNDLNQYPKGHFLSSRKRYVKQRALKKEVNVLQKITRAASTERYMLISAGQVTNTQASVAAYSRFEAAAQNVGLNPIQFVEAAPIAFQGCLDQRNNQTARGGGTHYHGQVTINNNCCGHATALAAAPIAEEEIQNTQEHDAGVEVPFGTSASGPSASALNEVVTSYRSLLITAFQRLAPYFTSSESNKASTSQEGLVNMLQQEPSATASGS